MTNKNYYATSITFARQTISELSSYHRGSVDIPDYMKPFTPIITEGEFVGVNLPEGSGFDGTWNATLTESYVRFHGDYHVMDG